MIRYRCDTCGTDLAPDCSNHFIVKIEAFATAGKLEFTREDWNRDHAAEIKRAIQQAQRQTADEIEDQVYRHFRFDLCPTCHRRFLARPLDGASPG